MPKDTSRRSTRPPKPALRIVKGDRDAPPRKEAADEPTGSRTRTEKTGHGKRVTFDLETWHALNMLARDRMMTFQELADEAFADLLRKHGRPRDLKDALKRSVEAEKEPPIRDR